MRLWSFIVIAVAAGLAACRPMTVADDAVLPVTRTPTIESVDERIRFTVGDLAISFNYPPQWEYYTTEYGVVIAESLGGIVSDGRLDGLLIHIWVPPLADFSMPAAQNINRAQYILQQIIRNPSYIGNAQVTTPQSFDWDGIQAAYYLLDNTDGNATVVIGMVLPQDTRLIAVSISAPSEQFDRVRQQAPALLDALTINGISLSGHVLENTLPPTLQVAPGPHPRGASLPIMPAFSTFAGLLPAPGD